MRRAWDQIARAKSRDRERGASAQWRDLATALVALWHAPLDGPPPGSHSAWRGGPVSRWADDVRRGVAWLRDRGETATATAVDAVWRAALDAERHTFQPGWCHGDVGPGNLLATDGRLSALIDFGCAAVGDRACDVAAAWTLFDGDARSRFLARIHAGTPADDAARARGRGWALWKSLLGVEQGAGHDTEARRVLDAVLGDG